MKKFIILVCFFSVVGLSFALPFTITSSSSPINIKTQNKVLYNGTIEHIFTHCLLAYPSLALSNENEMQKHYNNDCLTKNEFKKILKSLYENNYVLIDINSIFEEKNGKIVKKQLFVPKGKKPLILSFDDVNYDRKKMKSGMVDKIIVDKNGKLASETEITWSNTKTTEISYDNEFVPILEKFVEEYPDFSVDGAKGTICLTGYDGILGYRINDNDKKQQEINNAKIVVNKLKERGWNFACHSFNHSHMKKISDDKFKIELENWKNIVEPIIGQTKIYVYPYGEWEINDENNITLKKHQMLLEYGFELFCGVGIKPFFSFIHSSNNSIKTLFMDRTPIDGFTLRNHKQNLLRFFNTEEIYDYKFRPK